MKVATRSLQSLSVGPSPVHTITGESNCQDSSFRERQREGERERDGNEEEPLSLDQTNLLGGFDLSRRIMVRGKFSSGDCRRLCRYGVLLSPGNESLYI